MENIFLLIITFFSIHLNEEFEYSNQDENETEIIQKKDLNNCINQFTKSLIKEGGVEIINFGKFKIISTKNNKTIRFKASERLKRLINKQSED